MQPVSKMPTIGKKTYVEEHSDVAATKYVLDAGHRKTAEFLKTATEELPDAPVTYFNFAIFYGELAQHKKAKEWDEMALLIRKWLHGKEHPTVAASYCNLAGVYRHLRQYAKAKECDEKAIVIRKKIYGEEHPDVAASYVSLGFTYEDLGQNNEAKECNIKALFIRRKIYGEVHPDVAASYHKLARDYRKLGQHNEAKERDKKALMVREKIYGEKHPDVSSSYHNLAVDCRNLAQYNEAKESDKKALKIRKKIYGEVHPAVAVSYHNLAFDCRNLAQHNEAKECDEKVLMIRKEIYGEKHPGVAASYHNLALDCRNLAQHNEAQEYDEKALMIRKEIYGEEHPEVAASYHNLAVDCRKLAQYNEAEECDKKALTIRKKIFGEEHPDVASSYQNLAVDCLNQAQHNEAKECDKKSLKIRKKIYGEEHPGVAASYHNLAVGCRKLAQHDEAKECDKKALTIRKKVHGEEHPDVASSYQNLAVDYIKLAQHNEAKECDEKALMIRKKIHGEEHPDVAASYQNLAVVYRNLAQHNEAKECDEKALMTRKKIYGEEHPDVALSYCSLAVDCRNLSLHNEAKECDKNALMIRKRIYGEEHPLVKASYHRLAIDCRNLAQHNEAKEYVQKALTIRKKIYREGHPDKAASYQNLATDYETLVKHSESKDCEEKALMIEKKISIDEHLHRSEETEKLPRVTPVKINNASAAGNDNGSNICYNQSEKKLQVREDNFEGNSEEQSTARHPRAEDVVDVPSFSSLSLDGRKPQFSHSGPLTAEGSIKNKSTWKDKVTYSNIVTSEGGVVVGEGVKLVCPRGAVDDPKTIKITLEDSSKYYGILLQRDLENDVMFGSPIINLKPNGHVFKKPVRLTAKLKLKNFHSDEVFILHGTEARDGKIIWQDITNNSKMDEKNAEVTMEIDHFSVITALIRLQKMTAILTKDIVYRLNVLPFNYTISVLINKNSLREELALLFVSQDVYSEQFYQEQETSALVQLKAEGFRELHVRSLDGEGEKRVYNGEDLKVSVHLGKDYHLAESRQESFDFTVHSSVWWNTGEVFRLPLEWTEDVRILCGTISVQGGYGHRCARHVCEMDLCGYVRSLLGVKRVIFNLMPIAHLVKMPEELVTLVKKSRKEEDEQLEMILQHWLKENDGVKDIATLRKDLEMLKPEGYKVTQRGQMHIRQLRELATKISGSQGENSDLMKYFCVQIQALCKVVLRDCCMELEDSEEGIQRATLSTNHVGYLENRRIISKDIARKYRQVCSSTEDTEESISETFLSIVPHLIQNVKDVFAYERVLEVQNGLKGLCEETLKQSLSDAREAEQSVRIIRLLCVVCEILEQLCHENCRKKPPAEINAWGETLAILSMLNFLKPFFLHCPQDIRLHKRLELFSRRLKYIMSDQEDTADDVLKRDFSDVSLSLIHFARSSPSKLVRFELTASTNSPVSCVGENNNNENVQYDRYQQTYSQWFEISKESEDELQLHASAFVHVNGRICKKGAFQSVVILKASAEEAFDGCMVDVTGVAANKVKEEDTDNLLVVLCSTLRKKVIEALDVLKRKLSQDVVDFRRSEVTQCHLTIQSVTSEAKRVLALRLFYKWGSEALSLDSKDFVCFADSSADGACIPAEKFVGFGDQLVPMDTAPLLATNAADLGALDHFRRDGRIQCETTGLRDQLTPEQAALSLVTPTVASTNLGTIDQLQRHGRILCGKIEYHVHQHVNHMKGNVCVVGDKPKLNVSTLNDQMPSQCALPQGPSCAPHRSITDGKRSQESPRTPPNTGT